MFKIIKMFKKFNLSSLEDEIFTSHVKKDKLTLVCVCMQVCMYTVCIPCKKTEFKLRAGHFVQLEKVLFLN